MSATITLAQQSTFETGETIRFANNSDRLISSSLPVLDKMVLKMKKETALMVKVIGYTDNSGSEKYRTELSKRRAEAVKQYLLSEGVAADRISIEGRGDQNPIADNATEEGKAKNQRVELEFIKQ